MGTRRCIGARYDGTRCPAFARPWVWRAVCVNHATSDEKDSSEVWAHGLAKKAGRHLYKRAEGFDLLECFVCQDSVDLSRYQGYEGSWLPDLFDELQERGPDCPRARRLSLDRSR